MKNGKINIKIIAIVLLIVIISILVLINLNNKNINISKQEINKKRLSETNNRTLLWQNPNPESAMAEGYEIKLSSADYDELDIYYKTKTTSNILLKQSTIKGVGTSLICMDYTSSLGVRAMYRQFNYSTDTTYKTEAGYYFHYDTMGGKVTSYLIPVYIYGIKY